MSGAAPRDCPVCREPGRRRFQAHGHWIVDCTACGHRFADVVPGPGWTGEVYGDDYFAGGGAGYPDYLAGERLLRRRGRRYGRLLARHAAPGKLLDVGAAAGFILQGLVDEGWDGHGLEPNPRMAERARRRGLDVAVGSLEELDAVEAYDAVTLVQVLSHLHDLDGALRAAARALRPGGLLLVETWNRESLTARAFGERWHQYSPPSVLHWFTRDGLAGLMARYGLQDVTGGRTLKWIGGGHARSLLRHKVADAPGGRALSGLSRLIPDGLAIPYPGTDLFWALFRRRE